MGFYHFHGSFSNLSHFKGEVRRGMGYICRFSIKNLFWFGVNLSKQVRLKIVQKYEMFAQKLSTFY